MPLDLERGGGTHPCRRKHLLQERHLQLRKRANVTTLSDSTGASLTGRQTLLRALVLRRLLRHAIAPDERNVGILLPPPSPRR